VGDSRSVKEFIIRTNVKGTPIFFPYIVKNIDGINYYYENTQDLNLVNAEWTTHYYLVKNPIGVPN